MSDSDSSESDSDVISGSGAAREGSSADLAPVQLGFSEPAEGWRLQRRHFPSKLGGRPAWLDPLHLPLARHLACGHCGEPMTFLCQLYCPREDRSDCFHRTVFVFVCGAPGCSSHVTGSAAAVRCQLPRINAFYSPHPPPTPPHSPSPSSPSSSGDGGVQELAETALSTAEQGEQREASLCVVCGAAGEQRCGACHRVHYCSRQHQKRDWCCGHKQSCSDGLAGRASDTVLLAESELVIEDEPDSEAAHGSADLSADCGSSQNNTQSLSRFKQSTPDAEMSEFQQSDASESVDRLAKTDRFYLRFRRRIAREPHQLIRYQRGGTPLWVSAQHQPSGASVPKCGNCGAPRQFEFQVMPQVLNHVWQRKSAAGTASVDWGTLAVFTCPASCSAPNPPSDGAQQQLDRHSSYVVEFVWRQPM